MGDAGFDPLNLDADASLNQVVIGAAGGPGVAGLRAGLTCSRDALLALTAGHGLAGLPADRLADGLASAAADPATTAGRAAAATLAEFGRRLGALIATLRDPATPGKQGRTLVRRACLAYWLEVDSIWLGGGLLAGRCGPAIMAAAQAAVQAAASTALRPGRLALTPQPALAPLLGAARHASAAGSQEITVVADLGHTSIKTAIADRDATTLTGLRLLETCAAPSGLPPYGRPPAGEVHEAVAAALSRAAQRAAEATARPGPVRVIASVASYVHAGVPLDDGRGIYGTLAGQLAWLRGRIEAAAGADATVTFIHDGTAAAATAGALSSGTITAGTWLGGGFRPAHAPPLLNLAPRLQIRPG
jgi:hypothetical protein